MVEALEASNPGVTLPGHEKVARELAPLLDQPEKLAGVWAEARASTPDGKEPTAEAVKTIAGECTEPKPAGEWAKPESAPEQATLRALTDTEKDALRRVGEKVTRASERLAKVKDEQATLIGELLDSGVLARDIGRVLGWNTEAVHAARRYAKALAEVAGLGDQHAPGPVALAVVAPRGDNHRVLGSRSCSGEVPSAGASWT